MSCLPDSQDRREIIVGEFHERFEAAGERATQQPSERTGASWDAMLKKARLRNIADDGADRWRIESESGATYSVTLHTRRAHRDERGLSPSMYLKCNCPARRECRHIAAVYDMLMTEAVANEDYDAADWLERIM